MQTPLEYATRSDAPYKLATFLLVVKLQDAWEKFKRHGLATCFYVYVLVPVVSGAPHFPIMVHSNDGSNNTFSRHVVASNWKKISSAMTAAGLHLLGHASDGAAVMR